MSNNQSVEKLKVDIKHKLSTYPSLGSSVDEELADYVLLMLANRRTKYVAKDELSLFLKDLTNDFVDWLYDRIKDIPFKALCQSASSELVKKSEEELPSSSTSSKSKSRKGSDYVGNSVKSPERRRRGRKRRAGEDLTQSLSLDKPNLTYNPSRSIDTTSMIEATQHEEYSPKPIVKEEEPQAEEIYRTEDQEVVLHLRTDINENDELLDETNEEPIFELDKDERPKHAVKLARERFSQGLDSMNHGLPSTVGAVVNRSSLYGEEEEDEDNTHNRHNVASIIQVYERKSSVPKNLQANPKMVMRAVEEATRSTDNVIRGKRKMADMELDMDIPYTPTPIKRRLGLRMNEEYYGERVDTENVEHYYEQTARSRITEYDPQRSDFDSRYQDYEYENTPGTHNPRFIVTLEGASRLRKDRNDRIVYDDELLFDEEMDEEFQENDDSFANHNLSDMSDLRGKERCKYWPSCKNGNRCLFHHPSSPCRAFPNCKFGDKCLFIHPDCKFDALCTRSDCPYTHTSKRQVPLVPVKPIIAPTFCRYNANCVNPTCPFLHSFPKPCNFGASCRNSNCPFSHPPSFNQFKSLPKPHQLKWKSSERKFAVEEEAVESMPVEIETEKSTS